jgi:hypothetical protein
MNERDWLNEGSLETSNSDARREAAHLWTRRSALALTAGFLAASAAPGLASPYVHRIAAAGDHIVVSKKNRMMELRAGRRR